MNTKWTLFALLFSVAVNIAVIGTLLYFWKNEKQRMDVGMIHGNSHPERDIVWFNAPHVPPKVAREIDSLRRDYHEQVVVIRSSIESDRKAIITQLMCDPVNRDTLDIIIQKLADKQIKAERLTIDHLLMIKPLLPHEDWKYFIQDLRPRHKIQTKIIKLKDGDSTSILIDEEEIDEFQIFEHQKKKIIEYEHKN